MSVTVPTAAEHAAPPPPRTRWSPLLVALLLAGLVLGALASLLVGPRSPRLDEATVADARLAADVRAALGTDRGYQTLSAARVRDGQVTFAGLGDAGGGPPSPQTPYELGSITKTFTGLLLADAVERGELRLEDPVGRHLAELADTPVGEVTLQELATHTAGLPAFPDALTPGVALRLRGNENPYAIGTEQLLAATRALTPEGRGRYAYSNLGMSLLGHAEARAAGAADWPALATDRLLRPLGMTSTRFALSAADLPATPARPHHDNGWPAPAWSGPGYVPAGTSTWTTAEDLARYATALLAGEVPGTAALEPRLDRSATGRVGLAWLWSDRDGRAVTWHNGGTGGTRTILALDRERGQAVVILGNSTAEVDVAGVELATTGPGESVTPATTSRFPGLPAVVAGLVGLAFLGSFAWSVFRGGDRLGLATGVLSGVTGLVLLLRHGPWAAVPAWLWGALTGLSVVLAGVAVLRARTLPNLPARRPVLACLSLVATVAVLAAVIWTL